MYKFLWDIICGNTFEVVARNWQLSGSDAKLSCGLWVREVSGGQQQRLPYVWKLGVCDYKICGITIIAYYCLESIMINQLIIDLDRRYRVSCDVVQQIKRYYYYKC